MRTPRCLLLLCALLPTLVTAGLDLEAVIQYRQHVMKSASGHMGALRAITREKVPYREHALGHARGVSNSLRLLPVLFPPDSDFGETRARPEVWRRPEAFDDAARAAAAKALAVVELLESGADHATVATAVERLGEQCRECHKRFREKR